MAATSFAPLRHRDYALLWSASGLSNIGTWMQTVAVGALVAAKTGRASWAALVAVAAFLPVGVLAPIGGALADRLDRRRFLAFGSLVQASVAVALAAITVGGRAPVGAIIALTFLDGCTASLILPFLMAMIPDLVPREELLAAASLGSAQYNLGRVVGPALAGVVIALSSYSAAFVVNALSFAAVITGVILIRLPANPPRSDEEGVWSRIRAGASVARREPGCRSAIILITLAAFFASPFIALIPAKAEHLAHTAKSTAAITSAFTTAQGIGAVAGALLLAPLAARFGRRRLLEFDLCGACVAVALFGLAPTVPTAIVALLLLGGLYIGVLSGLNTLVQLRAPAAYRARVLSLFFVALGVTYPVGALIQGALADRFTLGRTMVGAALTLLAVLGFLAATRPAVFRAIGDDEAVLPV